MRKQLFCSAAAAAALTVGTAGIAHGAVIDLTPDDYTVAQWAFDDDLNPTFEAPGVSATDVTHTRSDDLDNWGHSGGDGPSLDGASYDGAPVYDGDAGGPDGRIFGRPMEHIDENAFEFSISVDESIRLDYLALDMGYRLEGPDHVRFAYSTDGFATEKVFGDYQGFLDDPDDADFGFGDEEDAELNVARPERTNFSWNRYVLDLDGVEITDEMDFRIYAGGTIMDGDWPGTGEQGFFLDNITVAIPEPASIALLGAGGLLLLRRRNRQA